MTRNTKYMTQSHPTRSLPLITLDETEFLALITTRKRRNE
jgi:hypothetical protein